MIKKLTENAYVFSVFAKFFSVLSGIIYSILFSRYLGAGLRGSASIINNYADIMSILLCLGAFQAYPYFKQRDKIDIYESFINNVFALMLVYFVAIIPLAILFRHNLYFVIALLLAPVWMASRQLNYVVLVENPKLSNIGSMILDISDLVMLVILMLFTKANIKWCITIVATKQVIFFIICIKNTLYRKYKFKPSLKGVLPFIRYGFVPMITIILMEINYKIDVLMLEWFHISTVTIGIYSLGVMLAQKVWMIPDALKDILLSKLVGGKGAEEVAKVSRISFFITMACEILILIFGKPLIRILYGSEYESAYYITLIICAGVIGMVFYKMIYSYNVANGHKNVNLVLLGISACANIILNAITIPFFGSYGAAFASLISYFICGMGFLIYFNKKTGIRIRETVLVRRDDLLLLKEKLIR